MDKLIDQYVVDINNANAATSIAIPTQKTG